MIAHDTHGLGICAGCQQVREVDSRTCLCDPCLTAEWWSNLTDFNDEFGWLMGDDE